MNEVNMLNFIELTREYLQKNQQELSPSELESVTELYEDLNIELARQQLFDDLYH